MRLPVSASDEEEEALYDLKEVVKTTDAGCEAELDGSAFQGGALERGTQRGSFIRGARSRRRAFAEAHKKTRPDEADGTAFLCVVAEHEAPNSAADSRGLREG